MMKAIQSDTLSATLLLTPVRTAGFGMVGSYIDIAPGKIHSLQPSVLFQVDLPRESASGPVAGSPIEAGLAGLATGYPVAVVTLRIGKLLLAAAFNPLDPTMRQLMVQASQAGQLPCVIEFNVIDGQVPSKRVDHALLAIPLDVFGGALKATEGMATAGNKEWFEGSAQTLLSSLPSLGLTHEVLTNSHLRAFNAIPAGVWHESHEVLGMLPDRAGRPLQ